MGETRKKRYTMDLIAKECDVSRITVHRVINKSPNVSEKTRAKIQKLIDEVNFIPNKNAMTLSSQKSYTVALILHNVSTEFSSIVYNAVFENCREENYLLYLASTNNDPIREEDTIRNFIELGVDGIIIFSVSKQSNYLQLAIDSGVSVVQILSVAKNKTDCVIADQIGIAENMANYLIEKGHKKICYVDGRYGSYAMRPNAEEKYNFELSNQRLSGYNFAMEKAKLQHSLEDVFCFYHELNKNADYVFENFIQYVKDQKPSAVMCYDDYTALCVIQQLEKQGYRIPEDISVTGHDNIDMLKFVHPRLTTVDSGIKNMAKIASRLLFERIADDSIPLQEKRINANIIEGSSVSKV